MKKILRDQALYKIGIIQSAYIIRAFQNIPIIVNIGELNLEEYLYLGWKDNLKYSRTTTLLLAIFPSEYICFPKRLGKRHILRSWEEGTIKVYKFQEIQIHKTENHECPNKVLEILPSKIKEYREQTEKFLQYTFDKLDISTKEDYFAELWILKYIERYGL